MRILLIILLIFVLYSCEDTPPPVENETKSLKLLKFKLLQSSGDLSNNETHITDNGAIFVINVSNSEFDKWNAGSVAGWPELMQSAAKEFYSEMKDEFDFLFFVLDNEAWPQGAPSGSQLQVKNTISGLGLPTNLDDTAIYGSAGRLQSVTTLWKIGNLAGGPILHEMAHRWMNFVNNKSPHWASPMGGGLPGATPGIFQAPYNIFADIELYLMGLIPASEVTEYTDILDQAIADHGERSPAYGQAQTNFRGAIIVITPNSSLSADKIDDLTTHIGYVENNNGTGNTVNFSYQTGGRGNLDLSGLHAFKK